MFAPSANQRQAQQVADIRYVLEGLEKRIYKNSLFTDPSLFKITGDGALTLEFNEKVPTFGPSNKTEPPVQAYILLKKWETGDRLRYEILIGRLNRRHLERERMSAQVFWISERFAIWKTLAA